MNKLVDLDATPALVTPQRASRAYFLPLAVFAIFALVPLSVLWGSQSFILALVTRIMILALAAMSLDLLIGYGAMISFGHAAYVGLGAYSVAILASHGITDGFVQLGGRARCLAHLRAVHRRDLAAHQGRLFHHDHAGLRPDAVLSRHLAGGLWRRRRADAGLAQHVLRREVPEERRGDVLRRLRRAAGRLSAATCHRCVAFRPCAARHSRESGAHGSHRLCATIAISSPPMSLPA